MATLKYIGNDSYLTNFKHNSSIKELCLWYRSLTHVQFDTETNVTKSIVERELRVLQFGDTLGEGFEAKVVFVVQWSFLSSEDKEKVRDLLRISTIQKIIHNVSFDYQMMLKEGVVIDTTWDTMTMEQCIYPGYDYDLRFFSLAETLLRRYHLDVSKEQQGNFGDDIINDEKLIYAATDVVHLGRLRNDERVKLVEEDTIQLGEGYWNENEAVLAFADMEYYGMGFNSPKWRENIAKAEPIIVEATKGLNNTLLQPEYLQKAYDLKCNTKLVDSLGKERTVEVPCILPNDFVTINWGSATQVVNLLKYIFPDLEKASTLELKKYLQDNDPNAPACSVTSKNFAPYLETFTQDKFLFLKLTVLKHPKLEEMFVANFRERMIADKYLLPKDTVCVNWNSNVTKLTIFKWFNPNIENTDADTVEYNILLPFFKFYKEYNNANSLVTKFGESFIEKHVDSDGRVRTRFNTILSTGRVSSSSPNIQQIPKNSLPKDRQKDYRSCFTSGYDDWSIISADYASQELCVIGTLSKDPVFLEALSTGKDLHSVSSELIYGDLWKNSAEDGCAYYKIGKEGLPEKKKCKCPKHEELRQNVKCLAFGLAYGLSFKGLAADLNISLQEAEELFNKYFEAFPNIKALLDSYGNFGKLNGYIRTIAPWRRKRYYPYWRGADTAKNMLAQIERASKNMPIQGSSSDMVKIALIEMRRWINKNDLRDSVRLYSQVHDEISVSCKDALIPEVKAQLQFVMEKAAEVCLGNTLLKVEIQDSKTW